MFNFPLKSTISVHDHYVNEAKQVFDDLLRQNIDCGGYQIETLVVRKEDHCLHASAIIVMAKKTTIAEVGGVDESICVFTFILEKTTNEYPLRVIKTKVEGKDIEFQYLDFDAWDDTMRRVICKVVGEHLPNFKGRILLPSVCFIPSDFSYDQKTPDLLNATVGVGLVRLWSENDSDSVILSTDRQNIYKQAPWLSTYQANQVPYERQTILGYPRYENTFIAFIDEASYKRRLESIHYKPVLLWGAYGNHDKTRQGSGENASRFIVSNIHFSHPFSLTEMFLNLLFVMDLVRHEEKDFLAQYSFDVEFGYGCGGCDVGFMELVSDVDKMKMNTGKIVKLLNEITNGLYGETHGSQVSISTSIEPIVFGYIADENGEKHDIRKITYEKLKMRFGEQSKIPQDWVDSFDVNKSKEVQLHERMKIMEEYAGDNRLILKGRGCRINFSQETVNEFLKALKMAGYKTLT